MRIAIAGFMHESNTFNRLPADRAAFQAQSLTLGADIVREWGDAHHEIGGFIQGVNKHGAELVPLITACATPSGPVRADVFEEVVDHLVRGLERKRPDGLLLALHGAMVCEAFPDGDGEVLGRLRQAVGPELPIVVSLDLHGNLSERLIEHATVAVAYRTCPHVDQRARGLEAAEHLTRILRKQIRPCQAIVKPPVIVNIMVHDTSAAPLKTVLDEARRIEQLPGILSVSVLPGFAYADVPQMGPSVVVVADGNPGLAKAEAERLGALLWDMRASLVRPLPGPREAVAQALAESRRPVVLVDTGDNVGGGSAGDGTVLLAEILRQKGEDGVCCLFAPAEVQLCAQAGVGREIRLTVGGKVDGLHGEPLEVTGRIRLLHDGDYVEPEARHGGRRFNQMGLTALVELSGGNLLVLTSQRHPPFSLGQLTCLGIEPRRHRLLVVKAAIAYRAAYLPVAGSIIEVDTPGLTAVNPRGFNYRNIRKMYPLEDPVKML
jgi:microcystin degradation protein MlrC